MVAATAGLLGIHWNKIAWGDAPTWFTGVLTGAAVLLTAIGLWLETRRSRRERAARTEAEKRHQAELVAAWEDHLSLDPEDYTTALQSWRGDRPGDISAVGAIVFIRVRNASELPVYSLRYRVSAGVRGTFVGDLAVLPPGTVAEVAIPLSSPPRGEGAPPEIAFTDTGNRRWTRRAAGALAQGDESGFEPDAGAYPSVEQHPTMGLPRPVRFGTASYSEATGTLVRPRQDPQVW